VGGTGAGIGEGEGAVGGGVGAAQPAKTTDRTTREQITMVVSCGFFIYRIIVVLSGEIVNTQKRKGLRKRAYESTN
jgi:hypothetical protein